MKDAEAAGGKKRTFRKFSYRGIDLEHLLELPSASLIQLVNARARRRFAHRGVKRKSMALLKRLNASKRNVGVGEKPEVVKTHLRNMIIVPEMIGSVVGVHNGKVFNSVEVKVRISRPCNFVGLVSACAQDPNVSLL